MPTNIKILKIILVLFLPITIILTNFFSLTFNFGFYKSIYETQKIYSSFQSEDIDIRTQELIGYFRGQNKLEDNFFSSQAKMHLADVKSLLQTISFTNNIIILIVVLICLIFIKKKMTNTLKKTLIKGSAFLVLIEILFIASFFLNFNFIFVKFHQIFFRNDLWLFPPEDNLVLLFPISFFVQFAKQLLINILISQVVLLFLIIYLPYNDSLSV